MSSITLSYSEIMTTITVVTGLGMLWFAYKTYKLEKKKHELETNIDQIKKFDQPTAMAMFQKTRAHEHNLWNFKNSFEKFVQLHRTDDEAIRLLGEIGTLRGEADAIVTDMIRVYRLSGAEISEKTVEQWIKDGFIPEHYRNRFVSHIR